MSDVNFTPTRGAYKELTPFRYWCQKVLPLVYDDSISYYELLCKVVNYLNITMEDVGTLNDDVTAMYTAYDELQDFVNEYFTDLNVQTQIDNKLDRMAADGSLNALIDPVVTQVTINSVAGALPDVVEDQLPDVVEDQIDDVVGEQIPGVVSQQIQGATDDWLATNISGSNALDSTLTLYGAAARSFSTGTLIDYYGNYLGAENRITAFASGFWENDNGVMVHPSDINLAYQSVSLNVVAGDKYTILAPAMIDVYSYVPRYAFTDNNYNIVSVSDSAKQGAVNKTIVVPAGATKLIVNDNLIFYQEVYRVSKMLLVKGELIGTSEIPALKADLEQFTVRSKNILPITGKNTTVNGVNVTYADGQLTFDGTATVNGGRTTKLCDVFTLDAGTYTFWSEPNTGLGSLYIQTETENTTISACNNNTTGTFTLNAETNVYFGYNFTNGTTYNNTWNIQLENGETKTTFEKPSMVKAVDTEARILIAENTQRIESIENKLPPDAQPFTFVKNGNNFSVVTDFNGSALTLTGFVTQTDKDNPAFDFNSYSGTFSKVAQDDIAPVYYNGSYRCGGHGNNVVMNLTAPSHGLSETDIGKSYTLDGVTWILLKIVDASHVWVISDITNVPTRPFITTMASSGTLVGSGGNIVYTAKSTIQLLPNNIKRSYAIYGDGVQITEDGTYTLEKLELVESYQSLDCVSMVEYLKTHVGSNTNTTYCSDERDGELLYEVTYAFHGNSDCVITQTLTALRDNLDMSFAGLAQAQSYSTTAYVPFTTLATPTTIDGTTLTLTSETWDDADFPPYKYYEIDGNTKMGFVCGYDISFGMGMPEVRKITTGGNAGNYNGTSAKIYPKFYGDGAVMTKGAKISGRAFRRPVIYKDNLIAYTWICDDALFVEAEVFASGTYTVNLDASVIGRNLEVIKASDTLHLANMVIAYPQITIVASGAGSATLKIRK